MSVHRTFRNKKRKNRYGVFAALCIGIAAVSIVVVAWIGIREALNAFHSISVLQESLRHIQSDILHYRYSRLTVELDTADRALEELLFQVHTSPLFTARASPLHRYVVVVERHLTIVRVALDNIRALLRIGIPIAETIFEQEGKGHIKRLDEQDKKKILDILVRELPTLTGIRASLQLVQYQLRGMAGAGLPRSMQIMNAELFSGIGMLSDALERTLPILSALPELVGHQDEVTYLLLFQNNAEVRATGGFIGTYGTLTLRNGNIIRFATDNVYNLDDHAKLLSVSPPSPLQKYGKIKKWYLRDSNWSPDFREAARQAIWFYNAEGGREHIDGVIAMTPDVISSLMKITGEISVDGLNFQPDQLYDQLQYQVEKGYERRGIPKHQRKDVIRLIADEMIQRISVKDVNEWLLVEGVIRARLADKSLLVYSTHPDLQVLASSVGWSGEVVQTDGDFITVIDSNILSMKTDAVMDKSIAYSLTEGADGSLRARMGLTYRNNGFYSWTSSTYQDYVRVLVPEGSRVLSSDGEFDISRAYGKMLLGRLLRVDPQKSLTVWIEYRLPFTIEQQLKRGVYTLFVQKQSGVQNQQFTLSANFQRPIKSIKPSPLYGSNLSGGKLDASSFLQTDKSFELQF